jgi:tetratricopeptide (TPR) repeat protein
VLFRSRWRPSAVWLAAAAGCLGVLVDNLLNVSLHFAVPAFLFWWAAGLAMGLTMHEEGRWRRVKPAAAKLAAVAAVLICCWQCWYWVKVWNRETHYFAGFKLLRQGATSQAIKELELSRDWGPREVNAVYELGNAYARAERFADADRTYALALDANAGYDEIYFNIGAIKSGRLGQIDKALDYFRTAAAINPLSPDVYNNLTAILLRDPSRHEAEALRLLERATRLAPDNPRHWHNLGYLHALARRWPQSIAAYSRALSLAPDMAASEAGLAAASAAARASRPPILDGVRQLRELEARLGRRDFSPESLDAALSLARRFPEIDRTRFLAGTLLLVRGRPAEAVGHLEWVVARHAGHASALTNLASALLATGHAREAAERFKQALAVDPGNSAAKEGLRALGLK